MAKSILTANDLIFRSPRPPTTTTMYSSQYLRARVATVVHAILFAVVLALPASAQMTLESMLPTHGSENVATNQPLVLNFSQPIDTTAMFGGEEGFFIGAQISPATGQPLGYSLNASRTQLTVNVLLSDDTQYTVILLGAKAESGDLLDRPYAWTFSTGTLPTGSVSGKVSFPGSTPQNAVVALFAPDFFTGSGDGEDDGGPQFARAAVVAGEDGSYQIDYVPDGTFLPGALKDVDNDGEPNASVAGEGLGFFDSDGDHVPDEISISSGQQVAGVDVEIHSGGSTARSTYDDVVAFAQSVHADAALAGIQGGELTPDGQGGTWLYIFYSADSQDTLGVAVNFGFLVLIDNLDLGGEEGALDPAISLPDGWIDSSVALEAAEGAGGSDFRMENPDALIEAGLFNIDLEAAQAAAKYGAIAVAQPLWVVSYRTQSNQSSVQVGVNAQTGDVVFVTGVATTALSETQAANQAAAAWQSDAQLVYVASQEPVGPDGRAATWTFGYYSEAAIGVMFIDVNGGRVLDQRPGNPNEVPSIVPLPDFWANSDVATAAADAASNDFRNQNPDGQVFASLSRGFVGGNPDRLLWVFNFRPDPQAQVSLTLFVDGFTGMVTTRTEGLELPASGASLQRYPNPSQGAVTLRYELDTPGEVQITVLNTLGQTVRRLVSGMQPAGAETLLWDGTDDEGTPLAPGNYWFRLKTDRGVTSKSVTVVR